MRDNLFPGLGPLRHRDFALYFSGLTVSQVGEWMATTTTVWLLYDITRSPLLLGLGGGIRFLSIVAFGMVGGAIADRVDRRRLLFITQSGFALSSLVIGILVLERSVEVWHVYLYSAVIGSLGSFDAPARRSFFPMLVPRPQMQNAVMLNAAIFRLGRLIGPGIAGVVIAVYGPAVSYFVNFLSYAAILVAVAFIHGRDIPNRARGSLLAEVIDGFRYSFRRPLVRAVVILESINSLFGINTALITIFASDVLHGGPEILGLLLSSQAVGALLGTTALVVTGDVEHKGRVMMITGVTNIITFATLAFVSRFEIAAPLIAALGLTDSIWATMRNTILQLQTEEAYRGRTMGVILLAGRGFSQAAQLESGFAVSLGGPSAAMLFGAAVIAASLATVNILTPRVRSFRGTPEPIVAAVAATPDPAD